MDSERFVNVGRKLVAGICFILFVCVLLLGCRYLRVSHDLAEPARQRRSSTENAMFSTLNCTQQLFPMNETVEAIVDKLSDVTDDYVSLVRLNIYNGNPPEQNDRVTWHWGLGARGRTMMYFPYDNRSLSLKTLSYGLHSVSISLNGDQLQNESVSDICLVYSLSKLVQQVRPRVINSGGFSDNVEDDIICKEWFSDSCFAATKIPGYSIFELQASTYHECWNVNMTCVQGDCNMNRSFRIDCTFLRAAFGSTYVLLLLVIIGGMYHIYSKAYNSQDGVLGDRVNILQINLIPPAYFMFAPEGSKSSDDQRDRYKYLYMGYWIFLFVIPFVFYLGAFLWYVTGEEYAYRSDKRGNVYKKLFVWGLDFGLANILYVIGAIIALDFIYKYRIKKPDLFTETPNNFESKKLKIAYYSGAFLLCFFRLSAAVMLLVEMLILAVIGLAINIKYGSPIWINWIVGLLVCIANVIMFFDSYQHLFNMIYSVGTEVDKNGGFQNKIFEKTDDGSIKIESKVLRDVIRKWLPFWNHILKTFVYIIVGTGLLIGLALVIIFIDRIANVSSLVEYLITAFPLVIAAAVKFKGTSLTAGGKAKNRMQDKLLQLEEDFRKFANCVIPLGLESNVIPDSSMTASNEFNAGFGAKRGRLNLAQVGNLGGAWMTAYRDTDQWIQVDLLDSYKIISVATQGCQDVDQWVTSYKLACSTNGTDFQTVQDTIINPGADMIFTGNSDRNTIVTNPLPEPQICRYVRLMPVTWFVTISLRMEIYGRGGFPSPESTAWPCFAWCAPWCPCCAVPSEAAAATDSKQGNPQSQTVVSSDQAPEAASATDSPQGNPQSLTVVSSGQAPEAASATDSP